MPRLRYAKRGVYFVQSDTALKLIKIGSSVDLKARLTDLRLQNACVLTLFGVTPTTATPLTLERRLHEQFKRHRKHGEWFLPAEALLEHIDRHAVAFDTVPDYVPPRPPASPVHTVTSTRIQTIEELAVTLQLGVPVIVKLTEDGTLPSLRIAGNLRYDVPAVLQALRDQTAARRPKP